MGMAAVMRAAALRPAWTSGFLNPGKALCARNLTDSFALMNPEPLDPLRYPL